jgi:hypothetical protein
MLVKEGFRIETELAVLLAQEKESHLFSFKFV